MTENKYNKNIIRHKIDDIKCKYTFYIHNNLKNNINQIN